MGSSASKKNLFTDEEFPASADILTKEYSDKTVEWRRPKEICCKAKFIDGKATRFDLNQGHIGNCYFVAAAASLVSHKDKRLFNKCVPDNQESNFCTGKFRFSFWQFGEWKEYVIDDQLPCIGKELVYAHNKSHPTVFWIALFEKAYAKVYGSYANIDSGYASNALVDFTGGISESIDLKESPAIPDIKPDKLYTVMKNMMDKASMLACDIQSDTVVVQENGLVKGHQYSITALREVTNVTTNQKTRLVRLFNPWGYVEWKNKPWCDGSAEWNDVSAEEKTAVEYAKKNDGEFWMAFEDFMKEFQYLRMCHIGPDAEAAEQSTTGVDKDATKWKTVTLKGRFVKGKNGIVGEKCTVELAASETAGDKVHLVVSLLQNSKRNEDNLKLDVQVSQVKAKKPEAAFELPLCDNWREKTEHYELSPGSYVITPRCTSGGELPADGVEFLLRVFAETAVTKQ